MENHPGHPDRVLGVFSSPALATEAPRVQEVLGVGTWEEKAPGLSRSIKGSSQIGMAIDFLVFFWNTLRREFVKCSATLDATTMFLLAFFIDEDQECEA